MNAVVCLLRCWLQVVFNEIDEVGLLYFNQMIVAIVKGENKVEEIWFSQIGWWLFLESTSVDPDAGECGVVDDRVVRPTCAMVVRKIRLFFFRGKADVFSELLENRIILSKYWGIIF
jgi:hypothetical protein